MRLEEDRPPGEVEHGQGLFRGSDRRAETWRTGVFKSGYSSTPTWCRCLKNVGQETSLVRNLLRVWWGTCYDLVSEYCYYYSLMNICLPSRFIETEIVLYWANVWEFFCFFFFKLMLCDHVIPAFLIKHILSFTKNGYPFSWNTGNLEIYQFEGNQLLASSFFSEGSSGMWCISVPPSVQFLNSKICRFVTQQLAIKFGVLCACVSVLSKDKMSWSL